LHYDNFILKSDVHVCEYYAMVNNMNKQPSAGQLLKIEFDNTFAWSNFNIIGQLQKGDVVIVLSFTKTKYFTYTEAISKFGICEIEDIV
jgi:hypothetical protein